MDAKSIKTLVEQVIEHQKQEGSEECWKDPDDWFERLADLAGSAAEPVIHQIDAQIEGFDDGARESFWFSVICFAKERLESVSNQGYKMRDFG